MNTIGRPGHAARLRRLLRPRRPLRRDHGARGRISGLHSPLARWSLPWAMSGMRRVIRSSPSSWTELGEVAAHLRIEANSCRTGEVADGPAARTLRRFRKAIAPLTFPFSNSSKFM